MTHQELYNLRMARWKARTDLEFLCTQILNYPDVNKEVHGDLMNSLQKFPLPDKEQFYLNDKLERGRWIYTPLVPMLQLKGKRRAMLLDFRGGLKTTCNVIAHTIQWILNYPDVAMLIVQANTDKAELCLEEIKKHFTSNTRMRSLFPEHCPQKRILDWGTQSYFTTEARSPGVTRKEKTVMTASIEKGTAGLHFDVMKFSDIVEENNSRTAEQCASIARSFYLMENLLVSPVYWIDVEGTRYHYADLYGRIAQNEWLSKEEEKREYRIYVRGCFKKKTPDGAPQKFTPEELELPDLLDADGKRMPWWLKDSKGNDRYPLKNLEAMEQRDPYIFSCQMRNSPSTGIGQMIFPVNAVFPKWISRANFKQNVRISHRTMTVDTAETDARTSNYSCLTVGAWSAHGKCYVDEIVHGKWLPDELVKKIVALALKHFRTLQSLKLEETSFVRGLMPSLRRFMDLNNVYLPIETMPRDTRTSKIERITNTLQPWYKAGDIVFLEDLAPKEHLLKELKEFPLSETDDILDSIADQFQGKTWYGRESPRPSFIQHRDDAMAKFLGIEDPFKADEGLLVTGTGQPTHYDRTGGL